ncbi:MAG: tetratricopeptide repeat protein, partial [Proteobacteria bacterium]|nr:tetratricopeptide repeat protein [Pseudomonadota bacterium]
MPQILRKSVWVILLLLLLPAMVPAAADNVAGDSTSPSASGFDWTQIVLAPGVTGSLEYRQHFEAYRESLANGSYEEAETTAKQMVELVTWDAAADRPSRARALHNLALVQHLGQNYDAAILNYQTAIDIIADDHGLLSDDLVMPLRGLGAAYFHRQHPDQALQTYDRALHISNVNHGPHSLRQQPILDAVMQIDLQQGNTGSAVDILDRILMLHTRKYSRDSEELLPILYQRAQLLDKLGQAYLEQDAWRQIVDIIRKHRGKSHGDLIEPYLALGRNLVSELDNVIYRSGPHVINAEWFLKHALSIAESNPKADWQTRKKCMLALADYYTLVEMHAAARERYRDVWDMMSADEDKLEQRKIELESVVPLSQPHPYRYANFEYNPGNQEIDPDDYLAGTMLVRFTINTRGRVKNIEVLEASPPDFGRMEWRVRRSLKKFVYRPRFADGK